MHMSVASMVLLLVLASPSAHAGDTDIGAWSIAFALGGFKPDTATDSLRNRDGDALLAFSADYRGGEQITWGFDALWFSQDGDTPAHIAQPVFGTMDERASVTSTAISATAKWVFGGERISGYLGGGIGLVRSTMRITGALFGFPGEQKVNSIDLGLLGIAGLAVRAGADTRLGLEWRRIEVDADFGSLSQGPVDLAGTSLALTWRWEMPRTYGF